MKRKGLIRWGSVAAAITTVAGALADPLVLGVLPHKAAIAVVVGGAIWQALTKPVRREPYERYGP